MDLFLNHTSCTSFDKKIVITGSKSESNRLLILKQLFTNLKIKNLSNSDDTVVLEEALSSKKKTINIGHAGTAMRFLTAFFATNSNTTIVLTGSNRMQKRPIKILVDALQALGADITYLKEDGFPPLQIKGKELTKSEVQINGNVSSQYISALLLIAPSLKNGLIIKLEGKVTSRPYVEMTLSLLKKIGIKTQWKSNEIVIAKLDKINDKTIIVESDWSAASYFYSLVALSKNGKLSLSYFKEKSLQGDKALAAIYMKFGVETIFKKDHIEIKKRPNFKQNKQVTFDLIKTPDIAQTIATTCFGLGVSCDLTGLHTLKIKETDRLQALKNELEKLGAKIRITDESLYIKSQDLKIKRPKPVIIETYDDHRMAMAFAPLSILLPITIKDSNVVSKSYPDFWKDLEKIVS